MLKEEKKTKQKNKVKKLLYPNLLLFSLPRAQIGSINAEPFYLVLGML